MSNDIMIIMVVAITTFLTRALPFIIFKDPKKTPDLIIYLSKVFHYGNVSCILFKGYEFL